MPFFKKSRPARPAPPLRVLIVSAELAPFTDGGASETVRADVGNLERAGVLVSIVLPRYRRPEIDALPLETLGSPFAVPVGEDRTKAAVHSAPYEGGRAFFIDHPKYFLRERVFGAENGGYLDNDERFAFFSRAVVEWLFQERLDFDILHCYGWATALVPLFLGTHYAGKARFRRTAAVLTATDLSAQGNFPPESLAFTGLNWNYFTPDRLALNGKFSYLKAGLMFADGLATGGDPGDGGVAEILSRRADSCVTISPGEDAARQYLRLYETALRAKKGGPYGR
jgi:starch synthase